ncbi:response regulator [Cohnella sp. 56]|uniref:response regulator n=1 Tax=Cohnella sp. 56 TaxID=3113722 RepID=UPI0030E8C890
MIVKIAVVDDEEKIRLGLAKLIELTGEAFQIVGIYAGAQELLDDLGRLDIDLIFTDIKMPQINGLQLIEQVQRRKPRIKFAILSGFNDFEFARSAIRQGVEDYLLKPVDQDELGALLHRIRNNLELERYRKAVAAEEHIRLLLGSDIRHLPDHMTQGASRELSQIGLFKEHFAVVLLRSDPELSGERLAAYTEAWHREHRSIVLEPRQSVIVVSIGQGDHDDTVRGLASTLLQRIPHAVHVRIGVSAVHQGPLKLRDAYIEAEAALQQVWYEKEIKAMNDFLHLTKRTDDGASPLRMLDKDFRPALQMLDLPRAEGALRAWLDEAAKVRPSWPALSEASSAVLGLLRGELGGRQSQLPSGDTEDEQLRLSPGRFVSWHAFTAELMDSAGALLHILKEARQENRVVETVKSYIQQHYTEELELQRLADRVYLTPSYLSKLFKTETGETITDYIISVRIAHAKELLIRDPSLKTYEVGEMVGYGDPAYFNKVFKKVAGLTPKEYRDRVRL